LPSGLLRTRSFALNEGDYPVQPGCGMQGREHLSPLMLVQQGELGEQPGEPGRFHDPFPIEYDRGVDLESAQQFNPRPQLTMTAPKKKPARAGFEASILVWTALIRDRAIFCFFVTGAVQEFPCYQHLVKSSY